MIARQMVNFMYLIGDRETGEAVVVDPAYDPQGLVDVLAADGMTLTGVLATHYHPDHVGGNMMGYSIAGIAELLEVTSVPIHVQDAEADLVRKVTDVAEGDLVRHASGDVVRVGAIEIELIHTPGHTPGSQCFYVDDRLVAGDTLFLEGCGRTDLPGGDPPQMYESITQRLARIPDEATLFPGHLYAPQGVGVDGRNPWIELRVRSEDARAVDGDVRVLNPGLRSSRRRIFCRFIPVRSVCSVRESPGASMQDHPLDHRGAVAPDVVEHLDLVTAELRRRIAGIGLAIAELREETGPPAGLRQTGAITPFPFWIVRPNPALPGWSMYWLIRRNRV